MKLIMLLGLTAFALAKIPSSAWEEENFGVMGELEQSRFQRGSEYEFHYNGQVASGIPGSSPQHSATRLQARVSLAIKGENKAILSIHNIRMGKLNERMRNPRTMVPFMAFEEVELSEEKKQELQLPVMFSYQQGLVSDLVFDGREKAWSANIKKGILNMLQVNMGKRGEVKNAQEAQILNETPRSQENEKSESFTTQEKTVEGECKTLYTVVSHPAQPGEPVLNVTRTIQMEDCKVRPEVKYNFRFQDPCESCADDQFTQDQKFIKSSSVAKFAVSGSREEFLIQSAILEGQYQVVPFTQEGNVITTYVNQSLVLTRSGPIRSKNLRQPRNPQQSDSGLVYTLDWDKEMEEFLMKGEGQARLPVDIKDRTKIVADILRPLVSEMRDCVSEQAPVHYSQLVKIIRLTPKSQLEQMFQALVHNPASSDFAQEEQEKVKAMLTDALADAATKDSVSLLAQLIKEEKMKPLRAAITIKQLVNMKTPSKEVVQEMLALLQSRPVQQNWILKQAVQLTLGSLVSGLCVPSEDRLALAPRPSYQKRPQRLSPNPNLCPQQLQDQLIQKMMEKVEQASGSEEKVEEAILALKTLSNMGLPKSIQQLESVIRSPSQKIMIRTEAILALRQLRETLPQAVTQLLLPIFANKQEHNELRVAAAFQLLQTQPGRPVLDQMARALFSERSQQVAAFVFTYMQSLANSSNPCEAKLARDLKLSLRHGRHISGAFAPAYSKYLHASGYSTQFRLGAAANIATLISNRTLLPQYVGANLHLTALGFWSKYVAGISVAQEGVEGLAARILRRTELSDASLDQILSRSPRAAASASSFKELKKVWEQLRTVARQSPVSRHSPDAPKAILTLKAKDQEFFMLPISAASIRKLPSVQEIRRQLQAGSHFNIHKAAFLHEMEYKIPTSIGFPLIVNIRIPTVAQISGQVRIQSGGPGPKSLEVKNMKPSVAASVLAQVTAWTPVVSSGVKISASAKICTPITAKAELEMKKASEPQLRISFQPQAQQKSVEFVKLETRPMTWTREYRFPLTAYPKAQYKTIMGEEWNRVRNVRDSALVQKTEELVQKVLGQNVRIAGLWHRTPASAPANIPVCPFTGPNHITIRGEPSPGQPQEYELKLSAKMSREQEIRAQPFQMEEEEEEMEAAQEPQSFQTIIKAQIQTKGAQQKREAEMETRIAFSPSLRILKIQSQAQAGPIPQLNARSVHLCTSAAVQYPRPAQAWSQVASGEKKVGAQMKATWGYGQCQEQNKVEVKIRAQQSRQQQQMYEEEPEFSYWKEQKEGEPEMYSPIDMEAPLAKAQQLFQYNLVAHYHNLHPSIKNATAKLFRALKTAYYWNTEEKNFDIQNPAGKIAAQLSIDAKSQQFFNLSVATPVENVVMTDAKLPMKLYYPSSSRGMQSQMRSAGDILENMMAPMLPVCRMSSQRLQTFDGVSIRAPISDCWTLLAQDCASEAEPAYAVLVKKQSPDSAQKTVKIITPHKTVLLIPQGQQYGDIKVKVNGKQLSPAQIREEAQYEESAVQIQASSEEQKVKVVLGEAGVRVTSDGYSVKVQASPAAMGAQCGLCGHYDGEVEDELRTPQGQVVRDARRFIQAHTIQEAQCQYPQQLSDIDSSSEELSWEPKWEQEEEEGEEYSADSMEEQKSASSASSEEWDREERQSPVQRHVVEEAGRQICVSVQPIPRCPADSLPQEYQQQQQEVAFRCISRSHADAHRIITSARSQARLPSSVQAALEEQEEAYVSQYSIPKTCVQY